MWQDLRSDSIVVFCPLESALEVASRSKKTKVVSLALRHFGRVPPVRAAAFIATIFIVLPKSLSAILWHVTCLQNRTEENPVQRGCQLQAQLVDLLDISGTYFLIIVPRI
jgi:hypothetical protein